MFFIEAFKINDFWRFGEFVGNDDDNFGVFEDNETDMFKRENILG